MSATHNLPIRAYKVGGCVRDELLGLSPKDTDFVVVGASPEEMLALGFSEVGADFPVFLHPDTKDEYALARTEAKVGEGYKGFTCQFGPDVTLEEDLKRRDLTINAVAMAKDGTLIDPYGGAADLKEKRLRHVSPAFAEDPLRVLRVARFAARYALLGFTVDPETLELMRKLTESGELETLTAERVWGELLKAFESETPSVFLSVLRTVGALKVILPEVDALYGVPQPPEHHPEVDTGIHVELVLDQARAMSDDSEILYAALAHDLGKALSPRESWPKHHGHEEAGVPLVEAMSDRLKVPKAHRRLAVLTSWHHLRCHRALDMKPGKIVDLFEKLDAFRRPETLEKFLIACEADAKGRTGLEDRPYPQADYLRRAFGTARTVSTQPFLEAGKTGPILKDLVQQERIKRVKELRALSGS